LALVTPALLGTMRQYVTLDGGPALGAIARPLNWVF